MSKKLGPTCQHRRRIEQGNMRVKYKGFDNGLLDAGAMDVWQRVAHMRGLRKIPNRDNPSSKKGDRIRAAKLSSEQPRMQSSHTHTHTLFAIPTVKPLSPDAAIAKQGENTD